MLYVERNNLETYIAQGAPWVSWHPQTLADQIIPGGADYAHHITTGTPGFSDLPMALLRTEIQQLTKVLEGTLLFKGVLFGIPKCCWSSYNKFFLFV